MAGLSKKSQNALKSILSQEYNDVDYGKLLKSVEDEVKENKRNADDIDKRKDDK